MWTVDCPKVDDTRALGRALGDVAGGGTCVALVGDLGAGKTCFAQGLGAGLGVQVPVTSPTFVLIAEYEGRFPLLHADLYRLDRSELEGVGIEEALEDWPGVSAVEWADRFPEVLPADHLRVELARGPVRVRATGARHQELLDTWRAAWERRVDG